MTDWEVCSAIGTPMLRRRLARSPQQLLGAGVDLGWREEALDPAVLLAVVFLDEADGALHSRARPASSSQSYFTFLPSSVYQRPER